MVASHVPSHQRDIISDVLGEGMIPVAADYAWFEERLPGLAEASCLTLVQKLTPEQVLARVGGRLEAPRSGVGDLFGPSMKLWENHPESGMFIAVTTVPGGDWALAVEVNGYLGATEEVIESLSAGTRLVSYYTSVVGPGRFYWAEDGDIRLNFNPVEAAYRDGSTPDAVLDAMAEIGFDLSEDGDNTDDSSAAALALAEYLTGVRITPELLEKATYTCGIVRVPQG
jgi:Family of unknown function (DUF6461)